MPTAYDPDNPRVFQPPPLKQPPPIVQMPVQADPSMKVGGLQASPTGGLMAPAATQAPPIVNAPPRVLTDKEAEQTRLQNSKPGAEAVKNPFLRGLAIAGDVASSFFPGAAAVIPGTTMHHNVLLGQANKAVADEQEGALKQAQAAETTAHGKQLEAQAEQLPALTGIKQENADTNKDFREGANDINSRKVDNAVDTADTKHKDALRKLGYTVDPQTGEPVAMKEEDLPPETREKIHSMQTLGELRDAQTEQARATAALRDAQARGDGPAAKNAQARIENAAERTRLGWASLGLHQQQQEMRAHGTENGKVLPGTIIADNGDSVGTANAQNVRPTTAQRNIAGSANTMLDLDARIRKALQNPEITKSTGTIAGRLAEIQGRVGSLPKDLAELRNDMASYSAFVAGQHPVRGIGAMKYFESKTGGLGQDPEQILGILDSNKATADKVQRQGNPRTQGSAENDRQATHGVEAPEIKSQAEYDKLPKGAVYTENGKKYRKP